MSFEPVKGIDVEIIDQVIYASNKTNDKYWVIFGHKSIYAALVKPGETEILQKTDGGADITDAKFGAMAMKFEE